MYLHFDGGKRNTQCLRDFFVRHLVKRPHKQGRAVDFRQLLQSRQHGVQFCFLFDLHVGTGLWILQVLVQRNLARLFSESLQKKVASNCEQISPNRCHPDRLGRSPRAHKCLEVMSSASPRSPERYSAKWYTSCAYFVYRAPKPVMCSSQKSYPRAAEKLHRGRLFARNESNSVGYCSKFPNRCSARYTCRSYVRRFARPKA